MSQFSDAYKDFIGNVGEIARKAIEKRNLRYDSEQALQSLRKDLVTDLQAVDAVLAVDYASTRLHPRSLAYFLRELEFLNGLYTFNTIQGTQKELDDVETGKESLEDLLGDWLPDWLKDLLKILDEILKLASGG